MALYICHQGYGTYSDSGRPYRWWTFEQDVDELDAKAEQTLHDHGPQYGAERFRVRDGTTIVSKFGADRFEEVFGWPPPRFKAPREVEEATVDALNAVVRALDRWRAATAISSPNSKTKKKPAPEEVVENRFLRLRFDGKYDNGERYRDWELKVDVPELAVSRVQDADPMHATTGDVLREDPDDDLTPFTLRRDGRRIGDPEWWQVRRLFVELDVGSDDDSTQPPACPKLQAAMKLIPLGPKRIWDNALAWGKSDVGFIIKGVFFAPQAIPDTDVRSGDVLVHPYSYGKELEQWRQPPWIHGNTVRLPRSQFHALETGVPLLYPLGSSYYETLGRIRDELTAYLRRAASRGAEDTGAILVVRPRVSPVSAPIEASSDEEAVFELLYQVSRGDE